MKMFCLLLIFFGGGAMLLSMFSPDARPTVREVRDPNGNFLLVGVRVAPKYWDDTAEANHPKFGDAISALGLPPGMVERFSGMVFTGVDRDDREGWLELQYERLPGEVQAGAQFGEGPDRQTASQPVPHGTTPERGVNVLESSVQPEGKGRATRRTVTARKRVVTQDSDTYVEGHPQMQTKSKGVPNLIPEKYRGQIATVQTTTQHELDGADINDIPEPDAPTGDQSQIVHEKVNDERYQKVVVDEVIDENADPLEGRLAYVESDNSATVVEAVVPDGEPETTGLQVVSSKVSPLGNGKSIKQDVVADTWTERKGSEYRRDLGVAVPYSLQYVAPPADPASDPLQTFQPVNKDRSLRRTQGLPNLSGYLRRIPARLRLDLPPVLTRLNIVWNSSDAYGQGDSDGETRGYSWSIGLSNSSERSASLVPDVVPDIRRPAVSPVDVERVAFFLPDPITKADVIAKVASIFNPAPLPWPVFQPRPVTITILGQSAKVGVRTRASASASANNNWAWGNGTDKSVSIQTINKIVRLPEVIPTNVAVVGATALSTTAIAYSQTVLYSTVRTQFVSRQAHAPVFGYVYISNLQYVGGKIPTTGLYLYDYEVDFVVDFPGWNRVVATVVNASQLAY
jgi:hypothetical protein